MSFNRARWSRIPLADNTGALTLQDGTIVGGLSMFTYKNASDTIATIGGADYFSDVVYDLAVGDVIMATGSDASNFYIVATVSRTAGTITTNSFSTAGVVGTANIQDGAITNAKVNAAAAIDFSKLASLTSAHVLVGNGSNVATDVAISGDITLSNAGVVAIASGVIVNADVNASAAIAFSKLASLSSGNILVGSAGNVPTSVAVSGDIAISNTGVTSIASGVIVNADVNASAAIDFSKLASLTSAHVLVGSAGNVATDVAISGDITLSNAGVVAIAAGVIVNADINAAAAISFSKLAALSSGNLLVGSAGNVATSVSMSGDATLANTGALTIAAGAVTSSKLAASTIQYAVVSVSAAEFKALYTTPKLLVAAAGANTQITLHRAMFFLDYGTTQFTAGGAVHIQYDSTTLGAGTKASGTIAETGINAATADSSFQLSGTQAVATSSTTFNKGLYLSNATQDFATGDSTFKVAVWYSVGDFS